MRAQHGRIVQVFASVVCRFVLIDKDGCIAKMRVWCQLPAGILSGFLMGTIFDDMNGDVVRVVALVV